METNNYCVYVHICPNDKKYYGMTKQNVEHRWGNGRGYKKQPDFYSDIIIYGWDNIQHIIIAKGLTEDEAIWLEEELIRTNRTYDSEFGYNKAIGRKYTDEQKEAMSGANNPMYGKRGTENPNYGRARTEEHKAKISKAHKGKVISEEHKAKMSGANNHNAKKIICTTTMVVFDCIKDAADYYGTHRQNISSCCNGKYKSAGKLNGEKLVWRYLTIIEL